MNEAFDTFDQIEYEPLRTWNRCVMFFNLREDSGMDVAKKYLLELEKEDLRAMYKMYDRVLKKGRDVVYKEVTHNMPLQEDEDEDFE
jgi:hypothetical protein